ncbi:MAG: SUMF1/EgtB/PvdO family nonheme iron enzyme [FCB group bacterium]|jgi:iron(II)-dependent oxidoreductase|nr:SUMF1/EgtB/PvdO family nonheme iron enzyme [FCB group bacterium]
MTFLRIGVVAGLFLTGLPLFMTGCRASQPSADATLVVESEPVIGAAVALNGQPTEKVTPAIFTNMSTDQVLVEVSKEGYKKAWRNVNPVAGQELRVALTMEPQQAFLSVDSKPRGAVVTLDDGTVLGNTPVVRAPVQVGSRTYTVKAENYRAASKTIDAQEYFAYSFLHQLDPEPAHLDVISRPMGATIFLNDMTQNKTTPATVDVVPGTYTVGVSAQGYMSKETVVTVGPNETRSILLEMEAGNVPPGMVLVPAGEFIMGFDEGAPDEQPQRKVMLEDFYIDKYEVTNAEFKRLYPDYTFESGKENHPATNISWEQADAYARAIGKRLPTEEEWEKAARGTDGREYPWGNTFDPQLCNTAEKPTQGVEEVGKYRGGASVYGCMDMAGNVIEWTASWYNAYPGNTSIEKDYGQVFRVLRGGSFRSNKYDVRCASREYDRMKSKKMDYGFRCAQDVAAGPPAR